MHNLAIAVSTQKRYRQGQILKLITGETISNQDELRKRLAHIKLKVTQATLSRDLRELKLVKTSAGYKPLANGVTEIAPLSALARALSEFLSDIRPAGNMLVLKTPPSGAQPLAAAVDAEHFPEIAGTIAGDDTVLIITATQRTRLAVQKRVEDLLK
jgi:transcriptional regulator of arginine metabolism